MWKQPSYAVGCVARCSRYQRDNEPTAAPLPVPAGKRDTGLLSSKRLLTTSQQVDRVIEYVPGQYAIGIKNVTVRATRHFFQILL